MLNLTPNFAKKRIGNRTLTAEMLIVVFETLSDMKRSLLTLLVSENIYTAFYSVYTKRMLYTHHALSSQSYDGYNKTKQYYTQLDSRKQVIAFLDRMTTIHKGSSTPTKMSEINSRQIH